MPDAYRPGDPARVVQGGQEDLDAHGPVLGVRPAEDILADPRLDGLADELRARRRRVPDDALVVDDEDGVAGIRQERLQPRFALGQAALGGEALGDVLERQEHRPRLAVVAPHDRCVHVGVEHGPVGSHVALVVLERAALPPTHPVEQEVGVGLLLGGDDRDGVEPGEPPVLVPEHLRARPVGQHPAGAQLEQAVGHGGVLEQDGPQLLTGPGLVGDDPGPGEAADGLQLAGVPVGVRVRVVRAVEPTSVVPQSKPSFLVRDCH